MKLSLLSTAILSVVAIYFTQQLIPSVSQAESIGAYVLTAVEEEESQEVLSSVVDAGASEDEVPLTPNSKSAAGGFDDSVGFIEDLGLHDDDDDDNDDDDDDDDDDETTTDDDDDDDDEMTTTMTTTRRRR